MTKRNELTTPVTYGTEVVDGLTKREYFAGLALQALIPVLEDDASMEEIADAAVSAADVLIEALNYDPGLTR